jgi:hypothetical protein
LLCFRCLREFRFHQDPPHLGGHLRGHANKAVLLQHRTEKLVAAGGWQICLNSTHDFTNFGWWNFGEAPRAELPHNDLGRLRTAQDKALVSGLVVLSLCKDAFLPQGLGQGTIETRAHRPPKPLRPRCLGIQLKGSQRQYRPFCFDDLGQTLYDRRITGRTRIGKRAYLPFTIRMRTKGVFVRRRNSPLCLAAFLRTFTVWLSGELSRPRRKIYDFPSGSGPVDSAPRF